MPREPLRQEQVSRPPIDVRNRRAAQRVRRIQSIAGSGTGATVCYEFSRKIAGLSAVRGRSITSPTPASTRSFELPVQIRQDASVL